MNMLNALHGDKPKEPPREWNIQTLADYFKYRTSPSRTNSVISDIMGKLKNHAIDNGDVKITTSDVTVESSYVSVPDIDTTLIKSIEDDEMNHIL